jgi:hypothetical protein
MGENIKKGFAQPGVVADRSRLQEGYCSMGRGKGKFQVARKRAGS